GFVGDLKEGRRQPIANNVWRYETTTNQWTRLPPLPVGQGAGAAAIVNRQLHYFGGCTANRVHNTGDHWVLSLGATSRARDDGTHWIQKRTLPNARDHLAGISLSSKIYAIGGEYGHDVHHIQTDLVDCFDPATNKWTRVASLLVPKSHIEWGTFEL